MSEQCDEDAARARRRRRSQDDDLERRVSRGQALVHLGELSSARQALEGAAEARGSQQTLSALSDPSKRPPLLRDLLPEEVANHVPRIPLDLDEDRFGKNLRSPRRGAAEVYQA